MMHNKPTTKNLENMKPKKTIEKESSDADVEKEDESDNITRRRLERIIFYRYVGCVKLYDISCVAYVLTIGQDIDINSSQSYKEVVASNKATNYLMTMNKEMKSLENNET